MSQRLYSLTVIIVSPLLHIEERHNPLLPGILLWDSASEYKAFGAPNNDFQYCYWESKGH